MASVDIMILLDQNGTAVNRCSGNENWIDVGYTTKSNVIQRYLNAI